jgi:hypothetical protein
MEYIGGDPGPSPLIRLVVDGATLPFIGTWRWFSVLDLSSIGGFSMVILPVSGPFTISDITDF